VSALVSRHLTRGLGKKISGRVKLSPAAMECTTTSTSSCGAWSRRSRCASIRKPTTARCRRRAAQPIADTQWISVTLDSGLSFIIGGGWSLPLGYPNYATTWIEMVGTDGALFVDDSHRDVILNTMSKGMQLPMSTMPGERVEHTYAGPMAAETVHFLEASRTTAR